MIPAACAASACRTPLAFLIAARRSGNGTIKNTPIKV
nr:MAG TPA: hypothetical protein [Caudoviricetes sp.]